MLDCTLMVLLVFALLGGCCGSSLLCQCCFHVAVVHVSRLALLVYDLVECHQGSMCCRMTIAVHVMKFPKLS